MLKNGRATIPLGTMKRPGFRDCRLTATIDGKSYKHHVKVGFSPERIEPYTALPADFGDFWAANLAELARTRNRTAGYATVQVGVRIDR